jgi:MFS family permease
VLLLRSNSELPSNLRWNFLHLIGDIFWWGVLNGTCLSFITVYVTRIGGDGLELGLLAAAPAVVNILFAIPIGRWLKGRNTAREVVLFSLYHRIFYLLWIPIPLIISPDSQIWLIILLTFLMNIPGVVLQVGFNDLFADAVPVEWRGYLAGMRNAALAVTSVLSSIICGLLLTRVSFPLNYQIVFAIGFVGAAISSVHLYYVWKNSPPKPNTPPLRDTPRKDPSGNRFQALLQTIIAPGNRKFGYLLIGLFGFHLTQFLGIPVFPLYLVNFLKLDDQYISLGNGLFFVVIFFISTQLPRWSSKFGTRKVVIIGAIGMGLYPAVLAFSHSPVPYLIGAALGGLAWGLAGSLLYNYLLEHIPEDNRPPYLAAYNIILYSAVLVGSLAGPLMADWMGMTTALLAIAILRVTAGLLLIRLG